MPLWLRQWRFIFCSHCRPIGSFKHGCGDPSLFCPVAPLSCFTIALAHQVSLWSQRPGDKKKDKIEHHFQEVLRAWHARGIHHFLPHPTGQNMVSWAYVAAKEAGKESLIACVRIGENYMVNTKQHLLQQVFLEMRKQEVRWGEMNHACSQGQEVGLLESELRGQNTAKCSQ